MKNKLKKVETFFKTSVVLTFLASSIGIYADDTEVFYSVNVSKPNLLFVLDISGSMNRNTSGTWVGGNHPSSRISIMKNAFSEVIADAPDNIQIGLMNYGQLSPAWWKNDNFNHHSVSGVAFPSTDIGEQVLPIIGGNLAYYNLGSTPQSTDTPREFLPQVVNNWDATGWTPIPDALYEAALYFRGERIHYGQNSQGSGGAGAHQSTYEGNTTFGNVTSVGRSLSSSVPKYKSPIKSSCQENYIVLMTDGGPTYLNQNGRYATGPFERIMKGNSTYGPLAADISSCANPAGGQWMGECGAEITHYLANNDNSTEQNGDQFIETFVVGFGGGLSSSAKDYLKSLATFDDEDTSTGPKVDGYFEANDPQKLKESFAKILRDVAAPKGTLASPGYSVNVKNGLEHEKDIYIPVFDRKNSSRWSGNLKKFKLVDVDGKRYIRGKNNKNATDETGNFSSQALDFWSNSPSSDPDGTNVERGGVANLLDDPDDRKILSNLTGDSDVVLNSPANRLKTSNISNITNEILGLDDTASQNYREKIINFMRGWDKGDATSADKQPRNYMGDMLHSEPLVVTYNKANSSGSGKEQYIFAATNEGYLHAFDTETGEEKFAFMPKELLSKLPESLFLNAGTQVDHKYGIDGAITGDFRGGQDGTLDSGDRVIIYFGLRRGGASYYALDVTDIDNPKLLWTKSVSDHPSMGQSWSTPYIARVGNSSGEPKEVVIVSGGYDEDDDRDLRTFCANEHDTCTIPSNKTATVWYGANNTWVSKNNVTGSIACSNSVFGDPLVGIVKSCKFELNGGEYDSTLPVTADVGNDIFIFDALNGDKIWSLTNSMRSQITNSIPGGVKPIDVNDNGIIDRIYFADTGGNVWRLDISERIGDSSAKAPALTKIASLGGSGNAARKFYTEPDVAKMRLNGKTVFAISLGSGFRAHPLDKNITDKFFVLIDDKPYSSIESPNPITIGQLAELTPGQSPSTTIQSPNKRGWVVSFSTTGEKVLGNAIAIDGKVIFSTLVPDALTEGEGIDLCAAPATYSRVYAFNILDGSAGFDMDGDGSITASDIHSDPLNDPPGKIQTVFQSPEINPGNSGEDGNPPEAASCEHPVDLRAGKKLSQIAGYDACRLEPVYWSDPVTEE